MEEGKKRTHSPNLCQFTLTKEAIKVIEEFSQKYGTSKSEVVNRALALLAGKYHVKILLSYEIIEENTTTTTTQIKKSIKEQAIERREEMKQVDLFTVQYNTPKRGQKTVKYANGKIAVVSDKAIVHEDGTIEER